MNARSSSKPETPVFVDPGAGTFNIWRTMPTQMIGIRVPRRSLPIDTGAAPLRLVPAHTAALQLLTGYLRGALTGRALTSALLADAVVSHVTELIALAHRGLRNPQFATRTISSIANDAGFGDLSYFNRTFRRRYNVTPSDVRQAAIHPR